MPASSFIQNLKYITLSAILAFAVIPQAHAEDALTAAQKTAVQEVVRQYILDNPSVIIEAVNNYKEQESQRAEADAKKALGDYKSFFNDASLPSTGNPKGDLVIVEFFDYVCGYCKKAFPEVAKLVAEDKNVKVVFIEMPILSEQSDLASRWALAAHKQDKYFPFHKKLMEHGGQKSEAILSGFAKDVGLDVEKLKKDAASEEITAAIKKNHDVAAALGIQGTPGFIVGEEIVRGYLPYDALKEIVKAQRDAAKK